MLVLAMIVGISIMLTAVLFSVFELCSDTNASVPGFMSKRGIYVSRVHGCCKKVYYSNGEAAFCGKCGNQIRKVSLTFAR